MRREDVQALFKRIPEVDHTKVFLVLAGGQVVNIDLLFKLEDHVLVVRGREAGSNDEGRAFFLPYDQISYLKIEKMVRVTDLEEMYGIAPKAEKSLLSPSEPAKPTLAVTPAPAAPTDPAGIARANLLARIQAARTSAGVPGKGQ